MIQEYFSAFTQVKAHSTLMVKLLLRLFTKKKITKDSKICIVMNGIHSELNIGNLSVVMIDEMVNSHLAKICNFYSHLAKIVIFTPE